MAHCSCAFSVFLIELKLQIDRKILNNSWTRRASETTRTIPNRKDFAILFPKKCQIYALIQKINQKESVRKIFWKNILKFLIHFDLFPFSYGKYSCIFSQWNLIQQNICKYYPVIVSLMERNDISYYKWVFLKECGQRNRC